VRRFPPPGAAAELGGGAAELGGGAGGFGGSAAGLDWATGGVLAPKKKRVGFSILTGKAPANPHTYSGKKPRTLKPKSAIRIGKFNAIQSKEISKLQIRILKLRKIIQKIEKMIKFKIDPILSKNELLSDPLSSNNNEDIHTIKKNLIQTIIDAKPVEEIDKLIKAIENNPEMTVTTNNKPPQIKQVLSKTQRAAAGALRVEAKSRVSYYKSLLKQLERTQETYTKTQSNQNSIGRRGNPVINHK